MTPTGALLFADESKARAYVMAAAAIPPASADHVRRELRGLLMPGQNAAFPFGERQPETADPGSGRTAGLVGPSHRGAPQESTGRTGRVPPPPRQPGGRAPLSASGARNGRLIGRAGQAIAVRREPCRPSARGVRLSAHATSRGTLPVGSGRRGLVLRPRRAVALSRAAARNEPGHGGLRKARSLAHRPSGRLPGSLPRASALSRSHGTKHHRPWSRWLCSPAMPTSRHSWSRDSSAPVDPGSSGQKARPQARDPRRHIPTHGGG